MNFTIKDMFALTTYLAIGGGLYPTLIWVVRGSDAVDPHRAKIVFTGMLVGCICFYSQRKKRTNSSPPESPTAE